MIQCLGLKEIKIYREQSKNKKLIKESHAHLGGAPFMFSLIWTNYEDVYNDESDCNRINKNSVFRIRLTQSRTPKLPISYRLLPSSKSILLWISVYLNKTPRNKIHCDSICFFGERNKRFACRKWWRTSKWGKKNPTVFRVLVWIKTQKTRNRILKVVRTFCSRFTLYWISGLVEYHLFSPLLRM